MNLMTRPATRSVSLSKTQNPRDRHCKRTRLINPLRFLSVVAGSQWKECMLCWAQEQPVHQDGQFFCLSSADMYTALQKVHLVGKQSRARSVITHPPPQSQCSQTSKILHLTKRSWDCDCDFAGIVIFLFFTAERICFPLSPINVLITIGIIIRCYIQVKEVLQLPLQGLKCGPILFILRPAVHHHVIHDLGAAGRGWHSVTMGNFLDHLEVRHGWKNNGQSLRLIKQETMTLHLLLLTWMFCHFWQRKKINQLQIRDLSQSGMIYVKVWWEDSLG